MKRASLLILCAALTGCVSYSEIEGPPQQVNFSDTAAQANIARTVTSEIRTVVTDPKGNGKQLKELIGASCEIKGFGYSLNVISPAKVALPTYLGATDPVKVTCKTDQTSVSQTVHAINATEEGLRSSSNQSSVLGVLLEVAVKGTIAASRNASKDKFRYPQSIQLFMKIPAQ